MTDDDYPVGRVAELARVSVRTLHHYEQIGLLVPSRRTAAGHRRYTADDLDRLRTVLFYRELDFPLDTIAAMLADSDSADDHLRRQHSPASPDSSAVDPFQRRCWQQRCSLPPLTGVTTAEKCGEAA